MPYSLAIILWQFVREQIGPVDTISVGDRLCLSAACPPSRQLLRQLALAHLTYHSCRKDKVIITLMNDLAHQNSNIATSSSSSSSYSSCSSSSSSSDFNPHPWPIVQSRAVGFCRAGSSLIWSKLSCGVFLSWRGLADVRGSTTWKNVFA